MQPAKTRSTLALSLATAAIAVGLAVVAIVVGLGGAPREIDVGSAQPVNAADAHHDALPVEHDAPERVAASPAELIGDAKASDTESASRPAPTSYWGRVVDADGGAPVIGARIEAAEENAAAAGKLLATTDARGLFELAPASSPRAVHVRMSGFQARRVALDAQHGTAAKPRNIALERFAQVEARIRDLTGNSVVGAEVRVLSGTTHGTTAEWSALTDLEGVARCSDLPFGVAVLVEVRSGDDSARSPDFVLERGESRVVDLTVGGGSRISGWLVSHDGRALAEHELWLTNSIDSNWKQRAHCLFANGDGNGAFARVESDALGHFVFSGVPAGRWWLGPAPVDGDRWRLVASTHVLPEYAMPAEPDALAPCALATQIDVDGSTPRELTLQVRCGLYITGRVLDPSGAQVRSIVEAHGVDVGGRLEAELGPDSRFLLGPLPESRFALWAAGNSQWADSEQLVLAAGARDVELRLRERCNFAGRITGVDPGEHACRAFAINEVGIAVCSVDSDGTFELRGMPAGRYDLVASSANGWFGALRGASFVAGAATDPVELALRPGAQLYVRCTGNTAPVRVKAYDDIGLVAFETLAANELAVLTVPAGRLRIEARLDEQTLLSRESDARAGEVSSVEFAFD